MNRNIKFRGKSSVTNEWVYGSLVTVGNESHIVGFDEVDLDGHHLSYCSDRPVFTKQGTIGQFTGLHDKNGKEAYENDLVLVNGQIYEVVYVKGMFAIEIKGCGYVPLKNVIFEIIGNIYDNKELLEE